jgi:transketolase
MPDTPAAQASSADLANAIRALAMDAVQKANSGHPGMPMGMAEIAEVLWRRFLRHNPANPAWADRDRFVLSNGHGSMLQYALLHLTGYDLPMEELRNFRQLHSKTPGHPEVGVTPGVETTTGPLGQGLANAVGFALAERLLAAEFNRPGHTIVDHRTFVFAGDGCMMEGVSHEACSLAGVLGLAKLVVFYDDNGISIDGKVDGWFRDNTPMRFAAYGWNVIPNVDGHDVRALEAAIGEALASSGKPTLVCCKTVIGKGSPGKAGSCDAHGAALGDKEIAATREAIGWRHAPFEIPQAVYRAWDARARGAEVEAEWNARFAAYGEAHRKPRGSSAGAWPVSFPTDGPGRCRRCSPRPWRRARRWPRARPRSWRSRRWLPTCRSSSAAPRTSPDPTSRTGRARSRSPRPRPATTCTSACASLRWPPSATASPCTEASFPTRARSSPSPTTRATPCAWPRS